MKLILIILTFLLTAGAGCQIRRPNPDPFEVTVLAVIPQKSGVLVVAQKQNGERISDRVYSGSPVPLVGETWKVKETDSGPELWRFTARVKK